MTIEMPCQCLTMVVLLYSSVNQKNATLNYNLPVLLAWQANMDLQYVLNAYACVMYVASYIMKTDRAMGELLKRVASEMNSTEVQNPRCKLDVFGSVLACAKSAHAFQELSSVLTLRTLSLSFVTNNSSSDSKAFLCCIAFSGSPTAVHRAFLFFDAKAWPQSQTDLFTCTTVLHCGHTFLRRIDLIFGITLWAYLSEPLVKDSHKRLS